MLKSHYKEIAESQDTLWWHLGMKAINESLLRKYLPKEKKLEILDAGCGPGTMLPMLVKYGNVIGVDISDEALKYARKRGNAKKGDVTNLKFKDETFDLVICMDVLYHAWIKDETKTLKGFYRILKKGGLLLVREPAYNWLRGREDVGSLTGRRFSKNRLDMLAEKSSFNIIKMSYINFFLFPIILVLRVKSSLWPNDIKGSSDLTSPPPPVNFLLFVVLKVEALLINYISFPFGSSLICVARKN